MTAKQARRLLFALATVLLCVAVAQQQQAKPNRTVSYFTKNDPKYGEVISALGDEPKCVTVDVNVHDDSASWLPSGGRSTKIDPTHETWRLTASPKEYSGVGRCDGDEISEWPHYSIQPKMSIPQAAGLIAKPTTTKPPRARGSRQIRVASSCSGGLA